MRVVIDTNILISFAIRRSAAFEQIFDHVARNGVSLVSDDTLAELFTVLQREKFRKYISKEKSIDYIEWYAGISEVISGIEPLRACRDPQDDKFISLAITGKADCIIAGDNDLADMIGYREISIYRPADFLKLIIKKA